MAENWILFLVQHNEPRGSIWLKAAMIHPIVDNCLSLVRSGVCNTASKIVIVVKLLRRFLKKLNMLISISDKWKMRNIVGIEGALEEVGLLALKRNPESDV